MTKSIPFRSVFPIPKDINEGMILDFADHGICIITKIKSVRFLDMRTMEIIGLCKSVNE